MKEEMMDLPQIEQRVQFHAANVHIMRYFTFAHLPVDLQRVSYRFAELALAVVALTPDSPERTVALRKLLESKDAAVRASLPE